MGREGWAAAIVGSVGQEWDVERRFRVTEVALAIMWVCGIPTLICRGVYHFFDILLAGVQLRTFILTTLTVLCICISFLFLC